MIHGNEKLLADRQNMIYKIFVSGQAGLSFAPVPHSFECMKHNTCETCWNRSVAVVVDQDLGFSLSLCLG